MSKLWRILEHVGPDKWLADCDTRRYVKGLIVFQRSENGEPIVYLNELARVTDESAFRAIHAILSLDAANPDSEHIVNQIVELCSRH